MYIYLFIYLLLPHGRSVAILPNFRFRVFDTSQPQDSEINHFKENIHVC